MPSLGADMEAGVLRSWAIEPGERVARGQVVGEVETDKGIIDLEIWEDGVVEVLLVTPGTKVPVGTPIARLRTAAAPGERRPVPPSTAGPTARDGAAALAAPAASMRAAQSRPSRATPAARQRARELGVELANVTPGGPHGAVTRSDVERAAAEPTRSAATASPMPEPETDLVAADRQGAMRQAIAAAMTRSKREIPHYYLGTTLDASRLVAWLAEKNACRPPAERILPAAAMLRAVALALGKVPELNGFWTDGHAVTSREVHLGVAISLRGGGLVAPAIRDAGHKDVDTLMRELRELVQRARAGRLRSSELSDPTVTVTNLGDQGVETVYGIIYPPQLALVVVGKLVERPWAEGGMLGVRPVLCATLAADHRASDGHRGARFLGVLENLFAHPEEL